MSAKLTLLGVRVCQIKLFVLVIVKQAVKEGNLNPSSGCLFKIIMVRVLIIPLVYSLLHHLLHSHNNLSTNSTVLLLLEIIRNKETNLI